MNDTKASTFLDRKTFPSTIKQVKSVLKPPVDKEFTVIGDSSMTKEAVERIVVSVLQSLNLDAEVETNESVFSPYNLKTKEFTHHAGCRVRISEEDLEKINKGRIRIFCTSVT